MFRIGNSVDIHNLEYCENAKQKIGGYEFSTDWKIVAHSDGDIVLHAVSESILGALGLGDLGEHFSDKDSKNKGLDSLSILNYAIQQVVKNGYYVVNLDLTIICEHIYFQDKKIVIKNQLINYLNTTNINVKATRFEDKKINKIVCQATILLSKNG